MIDNYGGYSIAPLKQNCAVCDSNGNNFQRATCINGSYPCNIILKDTFPLDVDLEKKVLYSIILHG